MGDEVSGLCLMILWFISDGLGGFFSFVRYAIAKALWRGVEPSSTSHKASVDHGEDWLEQQVQEQFKTISMEGYRKYLIERMFIYHV